MSRARLATELGAATLACALLSMSLVGATTAHAQAPASVRVWSSDTALTIAKNRVEFGLFQAVHWGVTDELELAAHPLLEVVLPHVEGKIRWLRRGRVTISTWHRLSYPTLLFQTVSREGTLGLLPANSDVPVAIALDTAFLVTISSPADSTHLTLELGLSVAPRLSGGDEVVLDFPFLYSRFAAVSTNGSTYAGLAMTTLLHRNFSLSADVRLTTVSVVPHGFVVEEGASLTWNPTTHFGLSVGCRVAHGRYPVGARSHVLPTIDVEFGF